MTYYGPTNIPIPVAEFLLDGNANNSYGTNGVATNLVYKKSSKGYIKEIGNFDGASSKVISTTYTAGQEANTYGITKNFTFSKLINPTDLVGVQHICNVGCVAVNATSGTGFWIQLDGDTIECLIYHEGVTRSIINTASGHITVGIDQLLEVIREDGNIYFYVNGIEVYTTTVTNTNIEWTVPSGAEAYDSIGVYKYISGELSFFEGKLGLERIYNEALNKSERNSLHINYLRKHGPSILQQYPELFEKCVGLWDFKGDASNLIDGVKGTVNGAILTTDYLGNSNSAYTFVTDNIDITGVTTTDNEYSVSINFNGVDSGAGNWFLDSVTGRVALALTQATTFGVFDGVQWNDFTTLPIFGVDTLVTFSFKGTTAKLYINGILSDTVTTSQPVRNITSTTKLGSNYNGDGNYGTMDMSFVIILDKEITSDEAKLLYDITTKKYIYPFAKYTPTSLPKPVLYLDGSNNGSIMYDQSGNGNDGAITDIEIFRQNQSKGGIYNGTTSGIKILSPTGLQNSEFAISVKINPDTISGNHKIVNYHNGSGYYGFYMYISAGTLYCNTTSSSGGATGRITYVPTVGETAKYTFVVSSDGNKLLKNGVEVGTATYVAPVYDSEANMNLHIGIDVSANQYYFDGRIIDIKILNQPLTNKQEEEDFYANYY